MVDLAAAYASCARDARTHYENFPVASRLVPQHMRHHVAAVYAFARAADDFADEGTRPVEERHRLLDGWLCRLREAVSHESNAPGRPVDVGEPANTSEIFLALGATIRDKHLPPGLFEDLLSAFRQDVTVTRYASWMDVMDYCRRSANPVGRLVLRIADYRDGTLDGWSDAICTALQLTNFWQDLKIDFDRGRIYIPEDELRAHGASPIRPRWFDDDAGVDSAGCRRPRSRGRGRSSMKGCRSATGSRPPRTSFARPGSVERGSSIASSGPSTT